ncbi:hypothetical protein D3C71_1862940 [compost metagenome]
MAEEAAAFQLRSPAVLVIGQVAACQVLEVAGAVGVAYPAEAADLATPALPFVQPRFPLPSAEPLLRRSA